MHYNSWQSHGDPLVKLKAHTRRDPGHVCESDGCEELSVAGGLCKPHYMQRWEATERPACAVDECDEPSHRRGLCVRHYQRMRMHGDPRGGGPLRRRRGTGLGRRFYEKRRAAHLSAATPETAEYAQIVLADPCSYCAAPAEHVDHIDPFALGGEHDASNLTASCAPCNLSKNATPLLAFLLRRAS